MNEEITKDNAYKLDATHYRTVQEACNETRRDEYHAAFMNAEKEKAWNAGQKNKYKKLYKISSDYTFQVSTNRRDIMITKHNCKIWPDPIPAKGRSRSGELMITHFDWPNFMPRKRPAHHNPARRARSGLSNAAATPSQSLLNLI